MSDRKQINVLLTPDQKSDWEDYVENHPNYTSLSQLVRTAVTREINDEYVLATQTGSGGGQTGADTQVKESISRIEDTLNSLNDRLHSLEASTNNTPEEIRDLALSLVDALPKLAEDGTPKTAYVTNSQAFLLTDTKFDTQLEALTEYANRHTDGDWSEHDVRQALERAVNDLARVQKSILGSETRFYQIDPDNPTPEEVENS